MSLLQVNVESTVVGIEHDGSSTVVVYGDLIDDSINYDPKQRARGIKGKKVMDTLQSIDLMDFQAAVGMLLRAELNDQQVAVPLPTDQYCVEIDVESSRSTTDIPLIGILKSVIDGANKEIIGNDVTIYEAIIAYRSSAVRSRVYTSKPKDKLSVRIYSINAGAKTLVVTFDKVPVHLVPKIGPQLLDYEQQSVWAIYNEELQKEVSAALISDGMQISNRGKVHVDMTFTGDSVSSKDIDNMARAYYPILNELGVSDNEVHSIHLLKQLPSNQQRSNTRIMVQ